MNRSRKHNSLQRGLLPLFALALMTWCKRRLRPPFLIVDASSGAPSSSLAANSGSKLSVISTERLRNQTVSFFDKFASHGPTLTLTLHNPSRTTLLGGTGGDPGSKFTSAGSLRKSSGRGGVSGISHEAERFSDYRGFGITSKLATLFHINSSASTTNEPPSPSPAKSQLFDGYMLEDGEICLDPHSSLISGSSSSFSRGLFSIRDAGSGILGGGWGSIRSFSAECVQNVHPEIQYGMETNMTPFPALAPWLSGLSCGMIWSPFPVYKATYPNGYGHKLLSVPHFIRCSARFSLPRLSSVAGSWRRMSKGITSSFTMKELNRPTAKDLDLGVTYRESPHRPGGTLELILGKSRLSLPPAKLRDGKEDPNRARVDSDSPPKSDVYPRNNHILVRLTTGRKHKGKSINNTSNENSILTSIEYAKTSFRLPNPFFLSTKNNERLFISPSFDFVEGTVRCVVSGDVGSSGRTRAVLRLDSAEESTLTVVRAFDESKVIAPTISLNSGKIVCDYHLKLGHITSGNQHDSFNSKVNSSIRAHVDPMNGILLKWTDGIRGRGTGGGSCWVTECRIPLGVTAPGPLAADVRVGRRWVV